MGVLIDGVARVGDRPIQQAVLGLDASEQRQGVATSEARCRLGAARMVEQRARVRDSALIEGQARGL